jgi:DNA-binding CsgD family transcriptional regulator
MEYEKKTKERLIEKINELSQYVAELKYFEEEIKQTKVTQEDFINAFLQNLIPLAISIPAKEGFVEVSNAFLRLLESERDEVIRHTAVENGYITEEQRTFLLNELKKSNRIENLIMEFRTKKGELKYGLLNAVTTTINNENYLFLVLQNATEFRLETENLERNRKQLEDMVGKRTAELERKNIKLQELTTTLKVLLKQREDDKKDMEERFELNIRDLVLPYIEQMKKGRLEARQRSYLDIIETNLQKIATPLMKNMQQFNLTPKQIKVASLVKHGKSTKEIAELLGISIGSIDVHRKNIRTKLGLSNRKANLQLHLKSLEQ